MTNSAAAPTTSPTSTARATCIYSGADEVACAGDTYERVSRSGCTVSMKCDAHYDALQVRLDAIEHNYPDSPIPPSWFDPTYAGETWDYDY